MCSIFDEENCAHGVLEDKTHGISVEENHFLQHSSSGYVYVPYVQN